MFHAFLRWKDRVYRQLFYVTDCDRSPNLLSRDACYTLGVLKPCYMVEEDNEYTTNIWHQTYQLCHTCQRLHFKRMKGGDGELSNDSKKQSIFTESAERSSFGQSRDILHVYSDIFTGDREVSRNAI